MRTNTKVRPVERLCSLDTFMHALGHQPAHALPPIPQTLHSHVGARQFGDFGTVLMAERPASSDLSARVQRWRTIDAADRDDLPLRARPDHSAEDRNFNFIYVALPIAIMVWVAIGLFAAWMRGLF